MSNFVVPVSYETLLCWQAWAVFFGIIGFFLAVAIFGLVVIVIGSVVFLVIAINCVVNKNYAAAAGLIVLWVICVFALNPLRGFYWNEIGWQNHIKAKTLNSVGTADGLVMQFNDGRTVLARSPKEAANGKFEVLTSDRAKTIIAKDIRANVLENATSNIQFFSGCSLSDDYKTLVVSVDRRWSRLTKWERLCFVSDIGQGYKRVLNGYWSTKVDVGAFPFGKSYPFTVKVYRGHRLVASYNEPSGKSTFDEKDYIRLY